MLYTNRLKRFFREIQYHVFEAKPSSNFIKYKVWAIKRILNIVFRNTDNLEKMLPSFSFILSNKDGKFYIPSNSDLVFTMSTIFEENLRESFSLEKNDGIFIDIGANAGKYSTILSKSYPYSKTIAFEPSPETFAILNENISLNSINHQITPLNIGLSDRKNCLNFAYSHTNSGVSHIRDTSTGQYDKYDYTNIEIEVDTLDNVCDKLNIDQSDIWLIKIDVEGHELNVLIGSKKTLSKMPEKAKLIIEIHDDEQQQIKVINYLQELGFYYQRLDLENFLFQKHG